jgi:phage baseplate assembly protein W
MDIDFPYHFDGRGRTATLSNASYGEHVRDMIEQLLLTNTGERVNRPDFGGGLLNLVFAPNSPELATAVEFTLQGNLQRWLGDVIDVSRLEVTSEDSVLRVEIDYVVRATGESRSDTFARAA